MPANEDWSAEEVRLVVAVAFDLLAAGGGDKAAARAYLAPRLDGRSEGSIGFKLENVSHVMRQVGVGAVPGLNGRPNVQLALYPAVVREAKARGLLPADRPEFVAMAVYVSQEGLPNLARGLATRTWGFPQWEPLYRENVSVGLVVIASGYSGGSPRRPLAEFQQGTVDVQVCRFVGPFRQGTAPHWEDELADNLVRYPCRFGIEPVASLTGVALAAGGPLGDLADALRRSAAHRGLGKLVPDADLSQLLTGSAAAASLAVEPLTDDLPETGQRRRRGLGRMTDAALRSAVELRGMAVVWAHYEARGWGVRDTSADGPWDLEVERDGEVRRVEVKGTTGAGTHVTLTAGEVSSCLTYPSSALAVVSDIVLDTSGAAPTASGGRLRLVDPWKVDESHLRPLAFEYRVPAGDDL